MTTLPPPGVIKSSGDSLEKKVYDIVEKYKENLPIMNDRNRLGFCLYKYVKGEGDAPETLVKTAKLSVKGITPEELGHKLSKDIKELVKK